VLRGRRIFAVGVAVGLGAMAVVGLDRLTMASALTTSYTRALPTQESLILDVYETLSGVGFFRATAARLTEGKHDDLERLRALQQWTTTNVRAQYAGPTRIVADNFYDIVRRGFGYCDQSAHVFATLARFAGYDSRMWFLRREDGVSPHTVAQVHVSGKWVVVDPWLGVVWHNQAAELLTVEDVLVAPELLEQYPYYRLWGLVPEDFARGTPFFTFPYQSAAEFLEKVGGKLTRAPLAPPPSSVGLVPLKTGGSAGMPTEELRSDAILAFDRARREHLDGRYLQAIDTYRVSLALGLETDMTYAAQFFVGLAYFEANEPQLAVNALKDAVVSRDSEWRPSALLYLGRAYAALGDLPAARAAIRESEVPMSESELATLGGQH
jgi:hypothetical protein